MQSKYKYSIFRVLRIAAGICLLILGVAGLVLPILQGILFLIAGTLLLAVDIPFFRRILTRIQKRFPRIRKPVQHAKKLLGKAGKRPPPAE